MADCHGAMGDGFRIGVQPEAQSESPVFKLIY